MTNKIPIQMNQGNVLRYLGNLYRDAVDALKEHISNAIDEHQKARGSGSAHGICSVVILLEKNEVRIEYPYGMNKQEFQVALRRVADSSKRGSEIQQIGRLGIGLLSFQQIGRKCIFFSKKDKDDETFRVVLREGDPNAEVQSVTKRDALEAPGIRISIADLKFDPSKARGPLAPEKLQKTLGEKFGMYLSRGWLDITIYHRGDKFLVKPPSFNLPRVDTGVERIFTSSNPKKLIELSLYFDPSGKGKVAIRHSGVVVTDDVSKVSAYGLEESVFADGSVCGFIDADFLDPLPARTGFEENVAWISFLDRLDHVRPQIEANVALLKQTEEEKRVSEIQREALRLVREIFDSEDLKDFELLAGMRRAKIARERSNNSTTGKSSGEKSIDPGDRGSPGGLRINYSERPFETGPSRHSRFVGGEVQANELNPNFVRQMKGSEEERVAYAAMIIGKETIAYNDKSGCADDYLERLLSFHFKLKQQIQNSMLNRRQSNREGSKQTVVNS